MHLSVFSSQANVNSEASESNSRSKFWGIWLPVPTFLAIINIIFWTWLILNTTGYIEQPVEKAGEWIVEKF